MTRTDTNQTFSNGELVSESVVVVNTHPSDTEPPSPSSGDFHPSAFTSAAINEAIVAANAAGGGRVVLAAGVYVAAEQITILDGVSVVGPGHETCSIVRDVATPPVRIAGSSAKLVGVTVDGVSTTANHIGIIVGDGTWEDVTISRCRMINTGNNACRVFDTITRFEFSDNIIDSCKSGLSMQCTAAQGVRICRNYVTGITGTPLSGGLQVYSISASLARTYNDVIVSDNVVADPVDPPSFIPIECTSCANIVITGNQVTGGTRGISCGQVTRGVFANNVLRDQTIYAFEGNNITQVAVTGNTATDCATFLNFTGDTGSSDVVISGNTITGTGRSVALGNTHFIHNAAGTLDRVSVVGNVFKDWDHNNAAVRLVGSDCLVADNAFHCTSGSTPVRAIRIGNSGSRVVVRGNLIVIDRDLVTADQFDDVITTAGTTHVSIIDNTVAFNGDVAAGTFTNGIGLINAGGAAQVGLRIERNTVLNGRYGISTAVTSTDLVVADNNTRTCAAADGIPSTVGVRRTMIEHEASAAPTTGTWRVGDRVWNTGVTAGGVPGWICTTAGTPGTWKAMAAVAT